MITSVTVTASDSPGKNVLGTPHAYSCILIRDDNEQLTDFLHRIREAIIAMTMEKELHNK